MNSKGRGRRKEHGSRARSGMGMCHWWYGGERGRGEGDTRQSRGKGKDPFVVIKLLGHKSV